MASRPTTYLNWTDGAPAKVSAPPAANALAGFTPGQAPPAQWVNYLFYLIDQWVQYLDQRVSGGGGAGSITSNTRLVGGGTWALSGTALSWSAAFQVTLPGQADTANQAAAGGVTIPDGSVAYVNLNVPFQYSASTTSGSTSMTNLSSNNGLSPGMAVSGPGIAANTTISSVSGNTAILSAAATATNGSALFTFASSGALTPAVAAESAVSVGPQTAVLARNLGGVILLGVGAVDMLLRDGEARTMRGTGYTQITRAVAGQSMPLGTVVYVADSTDNGRTAGYCYPNDVTSNGTTIRSTVAGVLGQAVTNGGVAEIVTSGLVGGFTALNPGAAVWANVYQAGSVQQWTPPFIAGTFKTLVGLAYSATQVLVRGGGVDQSMSPNPTFNNMTVSNTMTAGAIVSPLGFRMLSEPGSYTGSQGWAQGANYNLRDLAQNIWAYYAVQNGLLEGLQVSLLSSGASGNSARVTFSIYEQIAGTPLQQGTSGTQFKLIGSATSAPFASNGYTYKYFLPLVPPGASAAAPVPTKQGCSYWMYLSTPQAVASGLTVTIGCSVQLVS